MRFLHTMIRVRDIQKSLDFYCGYLFVCDPDGYDVEIIEKK